MLRISTKKQIADIIPSLLTIHHKLRNQPADKVFSLLNDCQQAAIAIGECIERELPEDKEFIPRLERYCEQLYQISQGSICRSEEIRLLDSLLKYVRDGIGRIQGRYQIVFFPYKVSMWDSLESIWMAASEDVRCECKVVPIPYYSFDANRKEWIYHYEGADFPEEVPVTDYREYSLEKELPEVAYVHNPYDNNNYVTSVEPAYYSGELKKYVQKLVYVPYYATSGFISEEHKLLPVYQNMDYMVAQSADFMKECREFFYYPKLQLLGSPKFDRVIRMSEEGVEIPAEWREVLGGKKTLMLNTSINCFLHDGEIYLKKLRSLFEWIKGRTDVALIWRPHPLLVSTIQSMRPQLMEQFEALRSFFQEQKIGVFDATPDVTKTVSIADAYIGEAASSVINLFGAAGKPIFILNNYMYRMADKEEQRKFQIADFLCVNGKYWITSTNCNGIFTMEGDWEQIHYVTSVPGQPRWGMVWGSIVENGGKLYPSSAMNSELDCYNLATGEIETIGAAEDGENLYLGRVVSYREKLFYLPGKKRGILEYNTKTKEWKEHQAPVEALSSGIENQIYEYAYDGRAEGRYWWIDVTYANRILQFDMETGEYQIFEIGDKAFGYAGIEVEDGILYLAEIHTGYVVRFDSRTRETQVYEMPQEFQPHSGNTGRALTSGILINAGDYLVTVPGYADGMVKIDKKSGNTSLFIPDFWKDALTPANGFHPGVHGAACAAKLLDENTLLVQRTCDLAIAIVDVRTEDYTVTYPRFAEDDLSAMLKNQDGFEKKDKYQGFFCVESAWFSLEKFVDDLVNGRLEDVKKRQKEELQTMAVNLDGTCGKKTHEFLMSVLEA